MALSDDITHLPDHLTGKINGHIDSHRVIHAALKNHQAHATTGWRNITSLSTATSGVCEIIRNTNFVTLSLIDATFDAEAGDTILTLPPGWRPRTYTYFESVPYWASDTKRPGRILTSGDVQIRGLTSQDLLRVDFTFPVIQNFPGVYPGVPA